MARSLAARANHLDLILRMYLELTDRYELYLGDCEADRERGYRPHYCEHGTNQWVDYDNICGPCEDGYTLSNLAHRWETAVYMAETYRPTEEVNRLADRYDRRYYS